MYIHRGLLLLIVTVFILSPFISNWLIQSPTAWYRPFIAWFALIVVAYFAQSLSKQRGEHD
jgi:hypothetical protein